MANLKRLTDRVKNIEKWIEQNEDSDTMSNMHYLIKSIRHAGELVDSEKATPQNFRTLVFEWMSNNDLGDSWNEFVEEKQNAVQEQETESLPVRDESEASEGVREEDAEEQKTTE